MIFNPNVMAAASGGGGAVVGTYTGNGYSSKSLTFANIEPACIILMHGVEHRVIAINNSAGGLAVYESLSSVKLSAAEVTVNFSKKTVTFSGLSTSALLNAVNKSGESYSFVAIPKA